ncbi:maltodextrin phosphorylase : Alpha-1,4 glucan phosphorylase OS=Azospirillum brasilense Sp245 GN=glgP PE=3 SV=1: Phosphorylase [Gemmata massiliana]|uniref:Alpha-1,4 glucan phosphorylase n=1 Tax=Gemmata massiliana TaxID=1210884 RepID=A0A6P2D4H8_9BACT|nr:glycogen/starch/alpha-glucan phosphorylase [Gemmata massiliana]VTR95345.1 maltodextrin phosphorylase : Alpha-1,4 glucan phosphorylase OS=Azospirillum brasilense Sp245 GN=glgP PE=3 SV=1: Phosphorylase [Gemmata massiliana]
MPPISAQPAPTGTPVAPEHNGHGKILFSGDPNASYERRLVFDHVVEPKTATIREQFEAVARAVRDLLTRQWLKTTQTYDRANPKRVYYLSMEFLIGRSLTNNITNLMAEPIVQEAMKREGLDPITLAEQEPDAGLGNGGLGRLAACFLDSMATMQLPAIGYGLRYEYGIFRQEIENGSQVERPDNWLRRPDPWEIPRLCETVEARLNCSVRIHNGAPHLEPNAPRVLVGVPYDRPIVGFGGKTVNTLRLWGASAPDFFNLGEFNHGDFFGAVLDRVTAESLTRVLYPDDSTAAGRRLRFVQEYFLVACSLADILRRFKSSNSDWRALPDKVAIQLNDTHPTLTVTELMRVLLDDARLGWDEAWDLTVRTLAYTNHTLLPEALERWPVELFELVLPRHLELIFEINRRFLGAVRAKFPGDEARAERASLIEEGASRNVRMAHLAIVGTHSTNGVAAIHSELLRTRTVKDLAEMFPERFGNKTNGITPRRWLHLCNPALATLITDAIGDGWVTDLSKLRALAPLAEDPTLRAKFRRAKETAKERFTSWLQTTTGQVVNPVSIFDCQIKRIHEYKRQLLMVLHIVVLYNRLRADPTLPIPPRTFFFAGKAAPAYTLAKLIIRLINSVAAVIDSDPAVRGKLAVVFLPEYNVSLAERLIPAADVSEQISTAGFEASGTSNMKFMMNGALTVGTRDGATIEMAQEAGEDNFFLFGLTADQVASSRGWYDPHWHYAHELETRTALDLIALGHFSNGDPGVFAPIRDTLLTKGDYYMHLADLGDYTRTQEHVSALFTDPDAWAKKALLNIAHSGRFSSDRTIHEYATEIWGAGPCPVD